MPNAAAPIAEFPNAEYGVTGLVFVMNDGKFSVVLRDDDAGEIVPMGYIFANRADAVAKAALVAAGPGAGFVS